jgi:hypothetical protein
MTDDTDTVATGRQAHEDTLMALADAGALPGIAPMRDRDQLRAMPGTALVFYRVARDVTDGGALAGATMAQALLDIAPQHHGHVVLAFDGWADDPRPLAFVPQVVRFVAGCLLGPKLNDAAHAQRVLAVLLDEEPLIAADHGALAAGGQCWLVAHAWASDCFKRHPSSPTGFARDHGFALWLRDALRSGYVMPSAGRSAGLGI